MTKRNKILLVVLVLVLAVGPCLLGGGAAVVLWLYAEQVDHGYEALQADQVEVVTAKRVIPAGTHLTRDLLTTQMIPRQHLPSAPLVPSEVAVYVGSQVWSTIDAGAIIQTSDLAR